MSKAIMVRKTGGPEVLELVDRTVGSPGVGEVRIKQSAIGLNFIDVYFRTGLYPAPAGLPFIPGNEGSGIVTELGEGVTSLKEGDRVAYAPVFGAYAEERLIAAERLVKVPDAVPLEVAGSAMLKGMTAEYLVKRTWPVKEGDTVLIHAAAGGVGSIAGPWAKSLGARVIGTVGSDEKAALAKANGYDDVINYRNDDFVTAVKDLTDGRGVDVVYDSVGKDTFPASLDCIRPRGMWVSFGQSSGNVEGFNIGILSQKGSLFATRPTLFTYTSTRADLEQSAAALFDVIASGVVTININQKYALADVRQAHEDLESRKTTGTTVLLP